MLTNEDKVAIYNTAYSWGAEIPDIKLMFDTDRYEIDDYIIDELSAVKKELAEIEGLSVSSKERVGQNWIDLEIKTFSHLMNSALEQKATIETQINRLLTWQPKTEVLLRIRSTLINPLVDQHSKGHIDHWVDELAKLHDLKPLDAYKKYLKQTQEQVDYYQNLYDNAVHAKKVYNDLLDSIDASLALDTK